MPSSSSLLSSVQKHYHDYVVKGGDGPTVWKERAKDLGYDEDFLTASSASPQQGKHDNDLSLWEDLFQASCGSGCPLRLHMPQKGDTVMDLGCGAGHDVVLARHAVGSTGKVVGIDFCSAMISAAHENIQNCRTKFGWNENDDESIVLVEATFDSPDNGSLLSEYHESVDIVTFNGVLNLCRDKKQVFATIFQLLKAGGRFVLSDVCRMETANPHARIACSVGDVFSS